MAFFQLKIDRSLSQSVDAFLRKRCSGIWTMKWTRSSAYDANGLRVVIVLNAHFFLVAFVLVAVAVADEKTRREAAARPAVFALVPVPYRPQMLPFPIRGSVSAEARRKTVAFEKENECDSSAVEDDEDMSDDESLEPPEKKILIKSDSTEKIIETPSTTTKDRTSPTKETSAKEDEQSPIISQIKKINDALILSNKAAETLSSSGNQPVVSKPTTPSPSPNIQAIPLLVQTPNGVGYASVSDGMILGMVQGSAEPKLIAMPLSSLPGSIGTSLAVTTSVKEDNHR
ncbi:hypothetical protein GWI33_000586 [Rhynchophorus ferrugineus]|uniref:Uncharacterized protein n=1 Tax=Rhynchophorus ferrugineus TaxID=354439 RepID=A0A834HQW5_RHYFE|nr:hypothetical protein GWI33_000590 [Rhynchophorus ferrugineus]KAF7264145.1 hypothetical protein GWI33_000586 [Rhynchophorus ferrugineus]